MKTQHMRKNPEFAQVDSELTLAPAAAEAARSAARAAGMSLEDWLNRAIIVRAALGGVICSPRSFIARGLKVRLSGGG